MARATLINAAPEPPKGLAMELRDVPPDNPLETLRRGTLIVSDRVGLVKAVGHGVHRAQDPGIFSVGVVSSDLSRFSSIANAGKAGGGGEDLEVALAATLGEAVERYSMLFYDKSEMVFSAYQELGSLQKYAIPPEHARLLSREQLLRREGATRLQYFDVDSKIHWQWGWSLTADEPRLVPASLVYLHYRYDRDEARIGGNASSGLAAGLSLETAILSGLYEVIERDAFTMSWLHRRVGRRIEVDEPRLLARLREDFHVERPDVQLQLYDITLDIPVTCLFALMRRPAEWGPALCVASVARLNPVDAVQKCLRELGQGLSYLRYLQAQMKDWEPREDHSDLVSFDHHFLLYNVRPDLVERALAHCDEQTAQVALSALPKGSSGRVKGDIEKVIQALQQANLEAVVVDITTEDVLEAGFRVVRVIAPGLLPMHGDHNLPYLGVSRLFDVPRRLGWPSSELNTTPHPFP